MLYYIGYLPSHIINDFIEIGQHLDASFPFLAFYQFFFKFLKVTDQYIVYFFNWVVYPFCTSTTRACCTPKWKIYGLTPPRHPQEDP